MTPDELRAMLDEERSRRAGPNWEAIDLTLADRLDLEVDLDEDGRRPPRFFGRLL